MDGNNPQLIEEDLQDYKKCVDELDISKESSFTTLNSKCLELKEKYSIQYKISNPFVKKFVKCLFKLTKALVDLS